MSSLCIIVRFQFSAKHTIHLAHIFSLISSNFNKYSLKPTYTHMLTPKRLFLRHTLLGPNYLGDIDECTRERPRTFFMYMPKCVFSSFNIIPQIHNMCVNILKIFIPSVTRYMVGPSEKAKNIIQSTLEYSSNCCYSTIHWWIKNELSQVFTLAYLHNVSARICMCAVCCVYVHVSVCLCT